MNHRLRLMLALLALASLTASLWAYSRFDASRDRARAAQAAAEQVAAIAATLQRLRPVPTLVLAEQRIENLPAIIAEAAQHASLFDRLSAQPLPDRPVDRTNTRIESGQQLLLRQTTLQQLVTFLYNITDAHPALQIRQLSLEAIPDSSPEQWSASVSVLYLRRAAP